jgi:hypothetical protein
MFANLDRQEFIRLLEKLGSDNEAEALSAARDLHAKVTVAGVSWDSLLAPDDEEDPGEEAAAYGANDDDGAGDEQVLTAPDADLGELSEADKAEALSLIEQIAGMKVSAQTKGELEDYKRDIAAGEFLQSDLRYLRALQRRLQK